MPRHRPSVHCPSSSTLDYFWTEKSTFTSRSPRNLCVWLSKRVTEVTSHVVNVLRKAVTGGQVVTFFVFQFFGVQVFFK